MASKGKSSKKIFWQNICLILSVVFFLFNINSCKTEETRPSVSEPIADYDNANKALEINPKDAEAYLRKALACEELDSPKEAIEAYQNFIQYYSYQNRSFVEYAQERIKELSQLAVVKVEETRPSASEPEQSSSDLAQTYNNQGNTYYKQGQYSQAIAYYTKALKINPRYADAYIDRGNAYYMLGQYDQALIDFNKALEINPRYYADAYNNRGVVYAKLGQYNQALADYNKALELNWRYADAYRNKGLICEKVGRPKEAIEAYQNFIQYAPSQDRTRIEHAQKRIKELSQLAVVKAEETKPSASEPEQLKIVPVSEAEQMKKLHSPADYIAFSLNAAQKLIQEAGKEKNYRAMYPEVFNLGGINQIIGLVYDQKTSDVIFVGKYVLSHPPLTLDDFKVFLDSRFIYGKWPEVSIDPTNETPKTGMQLVRYEGGIEDTIAGNDLVCGDYELKLMDMDILHPGISDLKTYWVLSIEEINSGQRKGAFKIKSRFWFFPIIPRIVIREGVAEIKGLKVGVFTEVLSAEFDGKPVENLAAFRDTIGDTFAESISKRFEELAKIHLSFARIQGLEEMVGLVHALQNLDEKPDFSYWLKDYPLRKVETKKEIRVLKRQHTYPGGNFEMSGGVQLSALAMRLKEGDVRALKEAVLLTRPKQDTLYWSFVIGEWVIPTSPGMINIEQVPELFTHAVFLEKNKRYDEAISLYTQIIQLQPDLVEAYNNRGNAYYELGQYSQAIADYTKALEINPRYADAYYNRGTTYDEMGQYSQAIADFTKAIEINPRYAEAYNNRGIVYGKLGQHGQAIADFTKAIEINLRYAEAYNNRGLTYVEIGQHGQAMTDYNRALEINPRLAEAYYNRGNAYSRKGLYDQAFSDFNRALEINPKHAKAYNNRGIIYYYKGEFGKAWEDVHKAQGLGFQIDPGFLKALRESSGRER